MATYRKYRKLIHSFKTDYDYAFFLDIIEWKLIRMSRYFAKADIAMNSKIYANQIDRLLRVLKVVKQDGIYNCLPYVNTHNWSRFVRQELSDDKELKPLNCYDSKGNRINLEYKYSKYQMDRENLRLEKAWHCLWLGLEVELRNFWD